MVGGHRCMEWILCRVVDSSCLPTHNIVPHTSLHDQPYRRTTKRYGYFPSMVIFQLLLRKFWIQTWFCNCPQNISAYFTLSLSTSQVYMIKERCWFSQIDLFTEVHSTSDQYFSFQPNWWNPYTQIRIITFSRCTNETLPIWKPSPSHASVGLSQIAFLTRVLPKDDHTDFAQEERLGLPYWTMI